MTCNVQGHEEVFLSAGEQFPAEYNVLANYNSSLVLVTGGQNLDM